MNGTPLGNEIDRLNALNKELYEALKRLLGDYRMKAHGNIVEENLISNARIALAKYEGKE